MRADPCAGGDQRCDRQRNPSGGLSDRECDDAAERRDPRAHEAPQRDDAVAVRPGPVRTRSEEHTSELQSLMRISYAVFCLKKKTPQTQTTTSRAYHY